MSEQVRLGDVTTKIGSGATPRGGKGVYVDSGTSFIRSQNVYDNRFSHEGLAFINDDAAQALRGVTVEPGDVLVNITGESVTRTCVVDADALPARVSQHVAIVRPDAAVLDSNYLKAILLSPEVKAHLNLLSSGGATRRALTKAHLTNLSITLPPIAEQRRIVAVLGALDALISRNAALSSDIVALADAYYLAACEAGTETATVETIAQFHNRRRIPLSSAEREVRKGNVPYYGATGVFGYVDQALFDEVLTLVGEDGSVVNDDGTPVVQYIWGPAWINNHAHPLTGVGMSTDLLYLALRRADVRPLVTGAVQAKVSMGNLKRLVVNLPTSEAMAVLERRLALLFRAYRGVQTEIVDISRTRDELLPLLMSGCVRVQDVEGLVA